MFDLSAYQYSTESIYEHNFKFLASLLNISTLHSSELSL